MTMTKREAMYLIDMRMYQPPPTEAEEVAAAIAGVKLPTRYMRYTQGAVRLYREIIFRVFLNKKTDPVEEGTYTLDYRNKRGGFTRLIKAAGIQSTEWGMRYCQQLLKGGLMHKVSEGSGKNTGKDVVAVTPSKLLEFPEQAPRKASKTQAQRAQEYRDKKKAESLKILKEKDTAIEALKAEIERLKAQEVSQ